MNFPEFSTDTLNALRSGDPRAADAFARACEPYIRAVIHLRLGRRANLRRAFDSLDIYQSVMCQFFVVAKRGDLKMASPQEALALLVRMALNNLIDKLRRKQNHVGGLPDDWAGAADVPPPDQVVANREFVAAVRGRLTPDEQWLLDQRVTHDRPWADIAKDVGGTADGVRMRLVRRLALARDELD